MKKPSALQVTFATNVKKALEVNKLSVSALSRKSGLSINGLSMVLRFEMVPSLETIEKIAGALSMSASELLKPEAKFPENVGEALKTYDRFIQGLQDVKKFVDEWSEDPSTFSDAFQVRRKRPKK